MNLRNNTNTSGTSTDTITVVTGSATTVDVHVSWMDKGEKFPRGQGGSLDTAITTAATTEIVPRPDTYATRVVTSIAIRNKDTTSNLVTVKHNGVNAAGVATSVELYKVTLAGGDVLAYGEGYGWATTPAPTVGVLATTTITQDVANADASANTIADVTGLSFSVLAGKKYWFRFRIAYTSAATTTGARWSINGPAAPTTLNYKSEYTLDATSQTVNFATAYDIPAAANASSLTVGNVALIEGFITPSVDGTVIARFASEVTVSAITALAGSSVDFMRVA